MEEKLERPIAGQLRTAPVGACLREASIKVNTARGAQKELWENHPKCVYLLTYVVN